MAADERRTAATTRLHALTSGADWWEVRSNNSEHLDDVSWSTNAVDTGAEREWQTWAAGWTHIWTALLPCTGCCAGCVTACTHTLQALLGCLAAHSAQLRRGNSTHPAFSSAAAWLLALAGMPVCPLELLHAFVATQVALSFSHLSDISPSLKARGWRLLGDRLFSAVMLGSGPLPVVDACCCPHAQSWWQCPAP